MTKKREDQRIALTDKFKRTFETMLQLLLNVSPSDSGAESSFKRKGSGYSGVLRIVSTQGKFIVSAVGTTLEKVRMSLIKDMHRKMKTWRNSRSFPEHSH